jgi:hypothetical protein
MNFQISPTKTAPQKEIPQNFSKGLAYLAADHYLSAPSPNACCTASEQLAKKVRDGLTDADNVGYHVEPDSAGKNAVRSLARVPSERDSWRIVE